MRNNILNKKFKYIYMNAAAYLIAANVLVFFLTYLRNTMVKGVPLFYWLSLVPTLVSEGCVWQFFTYMFVHAGYRHLFFNMFAILMFGVTLERAIGSREFLLFYFLTGAMGGITSYLVSVFTGQTNVVYMGASGAIYALLFLTSVMFPTARILLFFIIPLKMPFAVILYIIIEVVSQVMDLGGGIAHLIHLSGIAYAWIYCLLRFRISPFKVWRDAI